MLQCDGIAAPALGPAAFAPPQAARLPPASALASANAAARRASTSSPAKASGATITPQGKSAPKPARFARLRWPGKRVHTPAFCHLSNNRLVCCHGCLTPAFSGAASGTQTTHENYASRPPLQRLVRLLVRGDHSSYMIRLSNNHFSIWGGRVP
jgi:hypothetical protein